MRIWLKKMSVVLVAIMTLGLYIPSTDVTADTNNKSASLSESNNNSNNQTEENDYHEIDQIEVEEPNPSTLLLEKAKEQALMKLGPRIKDQLEDEFLAVILPKIEEELESIFHEAGEEKLPYYEITENPAYGYGERIFNVYDVQTKKDIAKFHVRRDFKPLEGYWFNFHYHLEKDNFEIHHEIGEIYWDKNIPPKWMS